MGQDPITGGECPPPEGAESRPLVTVSYAVFGLGSLASAAFVLWVGIADFRAGDVRGGLGPLAFLPLCVAGMTGAYERFAPGDGSRAMRHLALLLPVCILLSFLSRIV